MPSARRLFTLSGHRPVVSVAACGDPPEKEMQQAQGAIDAARAAGADTVRGRRIRGGAERAARSAGRGRASAIIGSRSTTRSTAASRRRTRPRTRPTTKPPRGTDADRALTEAMAALNDAHTKLQGRGNRPRTGHVVASTAPDDHAMPTPPCKKRAQLFERGDYLGALEAVKPLTGHLREVAQTLDSIGGPTVRRQR